MKFTSAFLPCEQTPDVFGPHLGDIHLQFRRQSCRLVVVEPTDVQTQDLVPRPAEKHHLPTKLGATWSYIKFTILLDLYQLKCIYYKYICHSFIVPV